MNGLLVTTDSPVHRLPAQVKLIALLLFVLCVVATPAAVVWAFGAYAGLLAGAVILAKLPVTTVVRRMAVETPFVVFALLLPFVATGPRIDFAGLSLSESGVFGAWNILAKSTLGVVAAILLSATTSPRDLLVGLERLRLPTAMIAILSFMFRYAHVVADDLHRMRIARMSRASRGGHLKAVAVGAGSLFVRSYERGERVHLAMLARGYTGSMPALSRSGAARSEWLAGLAVPAVALLICLAARL